MATEIVAILATRRRPPPMLALSDAPGHRVLLAGEPYPVAPPWPSGVLRLTGTLLLPRALTPRGPLSWVHPPWDTLQLCREIDIAAAVRLALRDRTEGVRSSAASA